MKQLLLVIWSSVGRKIISAVTGLALIAFTIVHLLGNLTLLRGNPDQFNRYSHFLESFGWLLYVLEIGLIGIFLFHIVMGVAIWLDKMKARPQKYYKKTSAGSPSRMTFSSRNMIIFGLLLFIFIVIHVKTFKYGPGLEQGYIYNADGERIRDLYRLVVEIFSNKFYVIGYTAAIIMLGFHLRHGFWSAFQSLGVDHPRLTPVIYALGIVVAILLAAGFLLLPVWIYFKGGGS